MHRSFSFRSLVLALLLLGAGLFVAVGCDVITGSDEEGQASLEGSPEVYRTLLEGGTVQLFWRDVENAEFYNIYRVERGESIQVGSDEQRVNTGPIRDVQYTDAPEPGPVFEYVVTAATGSFSSPIESEPSAKQLGTAGPAPPDSLTATVEGGTVTLDWVGEAGEYVISRTNRIKMSALKSQSSILETVSGDEAPPYTDNPGQGAFKYVVRSRTEIEIDGETRLFSGQASRHVVAATEPRGNLIADIAQWGDDTEWEVWDRTGGFPEGEEHLAQSGEQSHIMVDRDFPIYDASVWRQTWEGRQLECAETRPDAGNSKADSDVIDQIKTANDSKRMPVSDLEYGEGAIIYVREDLSEPIDFYVAVDRRASQEEINSYWFGPADSTDYEKFQYGFLQEGCPGKPGADTYVLKGVEPGSSIHVGGSGGNSNHWFFAEPASTSEARRN